VEKHQALAILLVQVDKFLRAKKMRKLVRKTKKLRYDFALIHFLSNTKFHLDFCDFDAGSLCFIFMSQIFGLSAVNFILRFHSLLIGAESNC
jgi:hypothetical protein